jgi:hypothetical protein
MLRGQSQSRHHLGTTGGSADEHTPWTRTQRWSAVMPPPVYSMTSSDVGARDLGRVRGLDREGELQKDLERWEEGETNLLWPSGRLSVNKAGTDDQDDHSAPQVLNRIRTKGLIDDDRT